MAEITDDDLDQLFGKTKTTTGTTAPTTTAPAAEAEPPARPFAAPAEFVKSYGRNYLTGLLQEIGPVAGTARELINPYVGIPEIGVTRQEAAQVMGTDKVPPGQDTWYDPVIRGSARGMGAAAPYALGATAIGGPAAGLAVEGAGAVAGGIGAAVGEFAPNLSTAAEIGTGLALSPWGSGVRAATHVPSLLSTIAGAGVGALTHHLTSYLPGSVAAGTLAKFAVDRVAHSILHGASGAGGSLAGWLGRASQYGYSANVGQTAVTPEDIQRNQLGPNWAQNMPPF